MCIRIVECQEDEYIASQYWQMLLPVLRMISHLISQCRLTGLRAWKGAGLLNSEIQSLSVLYILLTLLWSRQHKKAIDLKLHQNFATAVMQATVMMRLSQIRSHYQMVCWGQLSASDLRPNFLTSHASNWLAVFSASTLFGFRWKTKSDFVEESWRLRPTWVLKTVLHIHMVAGEQHVTRQCTCHLEPHMSTTSMAFILASTFPAEVCCIHKSSLLSYMCTSGLQCFDTIGWAAGRASAYGGVLAWLCLERGAELRKAQLMPLPLTVSCFSKIQIGFTFLVLADPGSPGWRAIKGVCVCVLDQSQSKVFQNMESCHFIIEWHPVSSTCDLYAFRHWWFG